jgi:hypothetical protein
MGEEKYGIPNLFALDIMKHQVSHCPEECRVVDPENIMHYIARGGYSSLQKVFNKLPEDVISEVEKAGLRGRGGAGFPTAVKWKICRDAEEFPKYLICNADEGDPGAFMDRSLMTAILIRCLRECLSGLMLWVLSAVLYMYGLIPPGNKKAEDRHRPDEAAQPAGQEYTRIRFQLRYRDKRRSGSIRMR